MRLLYPVMFLFYVCLFVFYKWGETNKAQFNHPSTVLYKTFGLDMSHHQGEVRWSEIDSGKYKFVYLKATEGETFKDKRFRENYIKAKKNGIKVGGYHFWSFCKDPQKQIENIVSNIPIAVGDLVPAVDFETIKDCEFPEEKDLQAVIESQVSFIVESLSEIYRKPPVIYTTVDFLKVYPVVLNQAKTAQYWVRSLVGPPSLHMENWLIWQYYNSGRINGVDGPVDLNVIRDPKSLNLISQP